MKKIVLILIALSLVVSCKSKRKTLSTKKQPISKRIVKDRAKDTKTKKIVTKKQPIVINKNGDKALFSIKTMEDLYSRKPHLQKLKIDYIKKYGVLAIQEMETYKIPASITLAQGLLESRYGLSLLTKKSKNHFGIKCHKWKGQRVYHDDDAKGECFRKYTRDRDSYRDHSLFLANKKRYAKLFTYASNDYKSWAKGLRKAGYATDKKYPQKLINLIETYELYVFDSFVLGKNYKPKKSRNKKNRINNKELNTHIVEVGETLYSISGIYHISVVEIKKYNNSTSNAISVGQVLQLAPNVSLPKKTYIVKKGDTIYSIARKINITPRKLMSLNDLKTTEIAIGQKISIE